MWETINKFIIIFGLPTLLASCIYIGRKLQKLDNIEEDVNEMRPDLKSLSEKMAIVWAFRADSIAPAHSPRQLNQRGLDILNKSGIKEVVDNKKLELLDLVKNKNASNPYDAEKIILDIMSEFPTRYPEIVEQLKTGAFKVGSSIDEVLLAGGFYLRNLIFKDLGFTLDDLDKPK